MRQGDPSELYTTAIVGCGRIAPRHFDVLRQLDGVQLVAVCDVKEDRARKAADSLGVPPYTDYMEMVTRERPSIVSILTESGSHAAIGRDVAPYVKALIIEKPMALTLEEADELIESCERSGTRLFVVKQNRYNPAVIHLRRALEAGRFGKLVMGTTRVRWCRDQNYYDQDSWRGTWRWDGGVFTNQASHHIDLLQWMLGPVHSVMAYTATRLVKIETEDTGAAIIKFASGALGVIEATTATRPKDLEGSLSVLGERGSVVIGGFAVNRIDTWNFKEPLPDDAIIMDSSVTPPNVYGFGHLGFYKDAMDALRTGRRAMLDGLEGRKSLELINALYESAATGSEVHLKYVPHGVRLGR